VDSFATGTGYVVRETAAVDETSELLLKDSSGQQNTLLVDLHV